jgi:branched-chain amino acid transport system substrate-binding protein
MSGRVRRHVRRIAALGSITSLALVATACGNSLSSDSSSSDDEVKIGLVVPASGVYEPLGVDMTNGFQLYLDEHDGQLGGKDVTVVKADEGEGPDTGVPAVNKVITQDQVSAVVGIVNSATALGVKDAVTQAKVPLIVANAGADDLADGSPYLWRTSFTNGAIGASLGEEVANEVGDGSVYVMAADYAAGQEFAGGFAEAFEAAGGTVAGESFTPFGTTSDWQPYLSKAQNSGAKAVFAFYAGAEAVNFVKQYSSFGLKKKLPLYGPGFLTEGGVLAAQGADAEGVRTSLHYSNLLDTPENQKFVAAYQKAYDALPTVYAVQAYDAAGVLDQALDDADEVSGESISEALGGIEEIESPRGTWSFDDQHNPAQPYFLREVQAADGGYGNAVLSTLVE